MLINQDIKDAISNNVRKDALRELVYKNDVTTLLQDGLEKVLEGQTTFEEILKLIELDDEDLHGGHGLENAINETNISKNSTTDSNNQGSTPKEEDKKTSLEEIKKDTKPIINEPISTKKVNDTINKVNSIPDVPKIKREFNFNRPIKEEIPNLENISLDKKEEKNTNEENEIKRRSTNLESFLAEAQQLLAKQQVPIKENNINEEKKTIEKPIKKEEPKEEEFDDYGLSDTINFINEYKRGLKRYNEQDK